MKKILLTILLALWAGVCLAAPLTAEDEVAHGSIGTWPGSLAESLAKKKFPEAEMVYFETVADMAQNVRQGKVEAFAMNRLFVDELLSSGQTDLEVLGDAMGKTSFSFVFAKSPQGQRLCQEFNEFLAASRENGKLAEWQAKWLTGDEGSRVREKIELTGEKGTLSLVTNPAFPPLDYLQDNELSGYEPELLRHFCAAYGYDFKYTVASFETGMAGVSTGQFDMGLCAVEYQPERAEHYLFSERICEADCVLVVRSDGDAGLGPLAALKKKFHDTFVRESRWKLFVSGLFTTVAITVFSVLFGTALGFGECLLYQEGQRQVNACLDLLSRLFAGMPIVVLLMVFYYIVFGRWGLSGTLVAIVAFSLLFGFSVFEMLKNATGNIHKGQWEGALALGFSQRQAFWQFIIPQAVRQAFPTYQAEIVGLLKSTAIVGYIAVQDLTKMADIVRAQTFDAFAPLIVITALYLIFVWLLQKITDGILHKLDPKQRSREDILQGVKP